MATRSTLVFYGSTLGVMFAGGCCGTLAYRWAGPGILWYLPPLMMLAVVLMLTAPQLPGGQGVVRCFRGIGAVSLALAGLVLFSIVFGLLYRFILAVFWLAPNPGMFLMLAFFSILGLLMDFIFASEVVSTCAAVVRPIEERGILE